MIPTKQQLAATINDLMEAVDILHTKMGIVQPLLRVIKKHHKTILWSEKYIPKPNHK